MQKYEKSQQETAAAVHFSMFGSGTSSSKPGGKINFVDWLQAIRDGKWREEVATIRGEKDPQRQSTLKKTTLQGCSPNNYKRVMM